MLSGANRQFISVLFYLVIALKSSLQAMCARIGLVNLWDFTKEMSTDRVLPSLQLIKARQPPFIERGTKLQSDSPTIV